MYTYGNVDSHLGAILISNLLGQKSSHLTNIEVHHVLTSYLGNREKSKSLGHSLIPQVHKKQPGASTKEAVSHGDHSGPRAKPLGFEFQLCHLTSDALGWSPSIKWAQL